ncbi:methionyl-tRNA formyltransferase [Mycobacterium sp. SWH-M5]|uniref:methionyl-tRNA formyltransferase n=1 Tax=Mycolicibacterium goodii TaxID=134601 RepID=UPI00093FE849|nr:methionyl-tRNA formyltransferase [Mycolicibacterium goodii]MBU8817610.1 methionyl-tRNA formyltransferase [Mycolicibacterium goodii]OKH70913.1 methionyl-tRNA formyltransferase [Mycobacterium sp. SWH-M5]
MRVVMFGYQTWGHRTLQALLKSRHDVCLVVTHPTSDHAYESIWADSVEDLAREAGIEVFLAKRPTPELIERVEALAPDVAVANNWRTRLPRELFSIPKYGTVNLHDSLLPRFTGFSPVIWSLISGASHTGLTAHLMDDELDTGDILLQRSVEITPTSTGTSLVYDTLDLVPEVLEEALDSIENGTAAPVPQDLAQRTFFHKRSDRDSLVDWSWPAADIERFIRALSDPYPNAYTYFRGERLRLIAAHVSRCTYGGTPGRVFIEEDGGMVIVAGAEAFRGQSPGLVLDVVRTDDGVDHAALDYFGHGGGYLTAAAEFVTA